MNILQNKSRGWEKLRVDTFYPIFAIYTPKSGNFDNFSPINANLDNFFPKKCNFGQISISESEKSGEIFHNFFAGWGIDNFFLAEYSPMERKRELDNRF